MKAVLISLLVLLGCLLGWIYQTHPEVFQDAIADLRKDGNGARDQLAQAQKQNADLTTIISRLQDENASLKANLKSLGDQLAQVQTAQLKTAAAIPEVKPGDAASIAGKPFVAPSPLPQQANWTWTTTDGKTFKNVVITKVEADCVSFLDDEGGARIYIVTLPPDIQKLLNYDPESAKIAGEARVKDDINNKNLLEAERARTQKALQSVARTDQPNPAPTLSDREKQDMQQQVLVLQADIRNKLRQVAQDFANDGYSRTSSHSAYEEAVAQEAQQVNDLQAKMGLPATSLPVYYPYYPYYYYYGLP